MRERLCKTKPFTKLTCIRPLTGGDHFTQGGRWTITTVVKGRLQHRPNFPKTPSTQLRPTRSLAMGYNDLACGMPPNLLLWVLFFYSHPISQWNAPLQKLSLNRIYWGFGARGMESSEFHSIGSSPWPPFLLSLPFWAVQFPLPATCLLFPPTSPPQPFQEIFWTSCHRHRHKLTPNLPIKYPWAHWNSLDNLLLKKIHTKELHTTWTSFCVAFFLRFVAWVLQRQKSPV